MEEEEKGRDDIFTSHVSHIPALVEGLLTSLVCLAEVGDLPGRPADCLILLCRWVESSKGTLHSICSQALPYFCSSSAAPAGAHPPHKRQCSLAIRCSCRSRLSCTLQSLCPRFRQQVAPSQCSSSELPQPSTCQVIRGRAGAAVHLEPRLEGGGGLEFEAGLLDVASPATLRGQPEGPGPWPSWCCRSGMVN